MRAPRTRTFGAPRSASTSSRKSVGMFRRPSMTALTTAVFTSSATKSPATAKKRRRPRCRSKSSAQRGHGRIEHLALLAARRRVRHHLRLRPGATHCIDQLQRRSAHHRIAPHPPHREFPGALVRAHHVRAAEFGGKRRCRSGELQGDGLSGPQRHRADARGGCPEDPRAAHAHIHQPREERMRALPHFHHQIAHHPLVLTGGKRRGVALQPLCQFRVRELDPRACLAAVSDVDPAEDGSAQRAHLLAVRQRELDHDPVPAHQPRCHFTEEEESPSLDYVQVALTMGKVREAHLEQVGVPLHAGSLRPACGASTFRPATGASAYMRYPTTAWTVKARSAPVPDIVMNRGPNLGFSPTLSLRSTPYSPASPNWGPPWKNVVWAQQMAMARSADAARRSSGVAWTPTTPPTGKRVMKSVPPLCE